MYKLVDNIKIPSPRFGLQHNDDQWSYSRFGHKNNDYKNDHKQKSKNKNHKKS